MVFNKSRENSGVEHNLHYRTSHSAMTVAFRFAPGPILVKKIVEDEPAREIGHVVP